MRMKWSKLDLATLAAALLVPAVAYFGYFQHRLARLSELRETNRRLENEAADADKITDAVIAAREKLRKLETHIRGFMGAVAAGREAHKAVGAVVTAAKDTGVNVQMLRPGQPVDGRPLSYLPVRLAAEAEFPRLYEFLRRIEESGAVMTVNKMDIESDPLAKRCKVTIELRIYYVSSDESDGGGAPA